MGRLLLAFVVLACAGDALADESRLGSLIRFYLNERSPRRREDFLEAIERLTENDARKVAAALRAGEHFRHERRPRLARGGEPPVFDAGRPRIQPLPGCAGDFAELRLPKGYDPARAHPLMIELGPTNLPVPEDALFVRVNPAAHAQARKEAWACEALVMSLLAHLVETVHVDPDRVFLRADGPFATLVWYVALHNPDRFAGVLAARAAWKDGAELAPNARPFVALGLRKHGTDRNLQRLVERLKVYNPRHQVLEAPPDRNDYARLMPAIDRWWTSTVRPRSPRRITLVAERGVPVRSYWLRLAPRAPSRKPRKVGRYWEDFVVARASTIVAELDNENLLTVKTYRAAAFDVFIGFDHFDPERPLRLEVNDAPAPFSKLILFEISDLLEDYRERRDTKLLYAARLTFSVR